MFALAHLHGSILLGAPEDVALGTVREPQFVNHDVGAEGDQSYERLLRQQAEGLHKYRKNCKK